MRVIEKEMLKAIQEKKDWIKDNTQVKQYGLFCEILLFGNHIADYFYADVPFVNTNRKTFADHPTRTTKSRLRALGVNYKNF